MKPDRDIGLYSMNSDASKINELGASQINKIN